MIPTTSQFKAVTTPSGKKAFEAYVACYRDGENEIMIGSPTREGLKERFEKITVSTLLVNGIQHVWIVKANDVEPNDAPRVAPAATHTQCSERGCVKPAAFIIDREAYCDEHRTTGYRRGR